MQFIIICNVSLFLPRLAAPIRFFMKSSSLALQLYLIDHKNKAQMWLQKSMNIIVYIGPTSTMNDGGL